MLRVEGVVGVSSDDVDLFLIHLNDSYVSQQLQFGVDAVCSRRRQETAKRQSLIWDQGWNVPQTRRFKAFLLRNSTHICRLWRRCRAEKRRAVEAFEPIEIDDDLSIVDQTTSDVPIRWDFGLSLAATGRHWRGGVTVATQQFDDELLALYLAIFSALSRQSARFGFTSLATSNIISTGILINCTKLKGVGLKYL